MSGSRLRIHREWNALLDQQLNRRQEDTPSDEALMDSFLDSHEDAFYVLVERYRSRMVNFCFRMLGSVVDAEDAAQEVFLKVFVQKHRYQRREPLRPWLYTIASNHCLNQLRRRRIIEWISLERLLKQKSRERLTSPEAGPEATLQSEEERAWLQRQIARLPHGLRAPLILKRLEGVPNKEIARILNISVSAVESRVHRALNQLRASTGQLRR